MSKKSVTIKTAVVSMESPFGEIERNLTSIKHWTAEAKKLNAEILCFPELSISGYSLSNDNLSIAENIPGPITDSLVRISQDSGILIIAGLVEKAYPHPSITQVVVSPDGLLGSYKKLHLSPAEKKFFSPGTEPKIFTWNNFTFGIGLCFDAHFPDLATWYGLREIDMIFYPHASPPPESAKEKLDRWLRYIPARAYDNNLYVAVCNQIGKTPNGMEFHGVNFFIDPKGAVIDQWHGDEEKILLANIDTSVNSKIRQSRMGYFLEERVKLL